MRRLRLFLALAIGFGLGLALLHLLTDGSPSIRAAPAGELRVCPDGPPTWIVLFANQ